MLINSEEAVAATQFFVDLISEHHVAAPPEGFDAPTAFVNDQLAMMPNGSWMHNFFNQQDVRVALWPFPRLGPDTELREAEVRLSQGASVPEFVRALQISEVK